MNNADKISGFPGIKTGCTTIDTKDILQPYAQLPSGRGEIIELGRGGHVLKLNRNHYRIEGGVQPGTWVYLGGKVLLSRNDKLANP